ncbi:hypothetical protein [Endozoicomonas sp. ISHI1]|uniref:hypothetical protein n=4 Tax=Endozoicomonas TaxID=305899 RepID=UPI0021472989|nr:hypothetical protein [Endozoicomonas sp. ISHI1]
MTPSSIPETVKIRKISSTTEKLTHEAFETICPTLFIFDAEQSPGQEQPAVYELPLSEPVSDSHRRVNSFQLPDNSAFVGNGADILPEFVIEGGLQRHYVMSATHNNAVYYLANIEIDSRNPLDIGVSSATASSGYPVTTPTTQDYIPAGILNLRGAGIFVAVNIRVVLDPANNDMRIRPVDLGCSNHGEFGTEENFVYRFLHSEFDLSQGVPGSTDTQNAALNVRCFQKTGQVQLTMKDTKTVISVPTETDTPTPDAPQSSGVLFAIHLWPRENVLSFVNSTCNSVVDQLGNDLSIDSAHPSDPDHYMGGDFGNYCHGIKMMNGAFGLKDREQAWGWVLFDHASDPRCWAVNGKSYRAGFASVSAWSSAGFDVACNCTMPTAISPASSLLSASSTVSPYTTQVAYTSSKFISDADNTSDLVPVISIVGKAEPRELEVSEKTPTWVKASSGAGLFLGGLITQTWFYFSKRIKPTWIRYTSQALATTLGLGLPAFQLLPKCISRLRGRSGSFTPSPEPKMSELEKQL